MRTVRCSGRRGGGAGGCLSQCMLEYLPGGRLPQCIHTPPPLLTEFLTHAFENITFPQLLLRTVIIIHVALRVFP